MSFARLVLRQEAEALNILADILADILDSAFERARRALLDISGRVAAAALALMQARRVTCLLVTRERKPVGILNVHDCLRAGLR